MQMRFWHGTPQIFHHADIYTDMPNPTLLPFLKSLEKTTAIAAYVICTPYVCNLRTVYPFSRSPHFIFLVVHDKNINLSL